MTVAEISELIFFLRSVLFGAFCGIAYDAFRFLRTLTGLRHNDKKKKAKKKMRFLLFFPVFLLDFFFALTLGLLYCLFLYEYHDGVVRIYSFLAIVGGVWIYIKTLGRLLSFLLEKIAKFCRKCVWRLIFPVLPIFHSLFHAISAFFQRISLSFAKFYGKIKERKKKRNKKQKREPFPAKKESYANIKRF